MLPPPYATCYLQFAECLFAKEKSSDSVPFKAYQFAFNTFTTILPQPFFMTK